ncbi:MAG: SRPBCC family protein, partial [Cyanobacteria bacterium HKST-UBA04]|nr:SRPBCC family protein [Cyanobacteria bacterium HKST-UBA04]
RNVVLVMLSKRERERRIVLSRQVFLKRTLIPAPAQAVYDWHVKPGAFEALTPPFERVTTINGGLANGISPGARVQLVIRPVAWLPLVLRWTCVHGEFVPGRQFVDEQEPGHGPFVYWRHVHRFEPVDVHCCQYIDEIEYRLPMGQVGQLIGGPLVRARLNRLFDWRHQRVLQVFAGPLP